MQTVDYLNYTATLETRMRSLAVAAGSDMFSEVADALRRLGHEVADLNNRVWALDRATHTHDEMEPEDG